MTTPNDDGPRPRVEDGGRGTLRSEGAGYERYLLASIPCSSMSFWNVSRISSG